MLYPIKKKISDIRFYFKKFGLDILLSKFSINSSPSVKLKSQEQPYLANLIDLYNLHRSIILNKRLGVMEFGSGWSTIVISNALRYNKKIYFNSVKNFRVNNPFFSISLENSKKYLKITQSKLKKLNLQSYNKLFFSECKMTNFGGNIATEYSNLPNFNPDLIYLDGPDQTEIKGNVNGINIRYNDFTPMNCDILKIEFFLTSGTIIVSDGRARNVEFLRRNFKRNWKYKYFSWCDQHFLELVEKPNGPLSEKRLNFYNKKA